ncbi:MAG: hypothetical protein OXH64_01595 [Rhodospirillaceae bacterium]|nr:hypothetical protein [Rhodospirillaceae bacterium]
MSAPATTTIPFERWTRLCREAERRRLTIDSISAPWEAEAAKFLIFRNIGLPYRGAENARTWYWRRHVGIELNDPRTEPPGPVDARPIAGMHIMERFESILEFPLHWTTPHLTAELRAVLISTQGSSWPVYFTDYQGGKKVFWGPQMIGDDLQIPLIKRMVALLSSTVVQVERHSPPRPVRRHARIGKDESLVTVVQFRRPASNGSGGDPAAAPRHWDKCWWVRGHWRHQRVGPKRGETRLVRVAAHIKGNRDAPLYRSTIVHDVAR